MILQNTILLFISELLLVVDHRQRGRRGMSSSQSLFDSRESLSSRKKGKGSGTGSKSNEQDLKINK